jgi:hypothetical protein
MQNEETGPRLIYGSTRAPMNLIVLSVGVVVGLVLVGFLYQ